MRLKRLDIVGFKSFMDKTVLQFDDGVTGVVGPNGCGKSNIVDAIRWVLGEQSPKHLRGASMSDVIFNGSQSRPPLGMAEVTLTFVNDTPDEVPARYRGFREIGVTRRLFRTGESEYLINKTPSRLLDITDLFLGTGVGTKAYSIIEQGRIGLVVSSKASDRRNLIEEAAGITRYKAKKKAAERKMDHTRNNLLRVGDLVSELEQRRNTLQRQAEKAAKYKELKAELREIELHMAAHRWLEVNTQRQILTGRGESVQTQLVELEETLETLEADVRRRRAVLTQEEVRLASMQEKAAAAEGEAKVHNERVNGLAREKDSLDQRTKEARDELSNLAKRLGALEAEREEALALQSELQQVLDTDRGALEARSETLKGIHQELAQIDDRIEGERMGALESVRTLSQGKSHQAALEKQVGDLEAREARGAEERQKVRSRIDEIQGGHTELSGTLDKTRQMHLELTAEKESLEETLEQVRERLTGLRAAGAELRDELSDKRSRLNSLQNVLKNYEGYEQGIRNVMLHREDIPGVESGAIEGLVADVVRATPELEHAVEAVLGMRLQSVLVRDRETARTIMDWLRDDAEGRGTFVPLAHLTPGGAADARPHGNAEGVISTGLDAVTFKGDHSELVEHLLGDVLIVENLEQAHALRETLDEALTLVTLDGTVVSPAGVLTGGGREGAGAHMLETRREIEELEEEVKRLVAELTARQTEIERLAERQKKVEQGLKDLAHDTHEQHIRIVTKEKELHRLSDELERLTERLEVLTHEHEQHLATMEEVRREIERTRIAMEAADSDQSTREARMTQLAEERDAAQGRLEVIQAELTDLQVKAAGDQERLEGVAKDLIRLEREGHELHQRQAGLEGMIEGSGSSFSDLDERMEEGRSAAGRLIAEAEELRRELTRARETVREAGEAIAADEEKLEGLRAERESLHESRGEVQMEHRELELEIEHLEAAIYERHAISLAEAITDFHMSPAPDAADNDRMKALRKRVDRMGEVNLTAIKEFEEVRERHDFLAGQKADLEASLDQLEKAITRINRTSRRRFLETFEAVNERFTKLFPRLFNGGKAGLSLAEPNNPLESGVDIFVQPPGKKLQSVNLLSGGEKALTAVSLLFSIFLVRPTPFCLLDEVDAPLDDNNVGRYNQMVREMASQSQFILITHNKQTMEIADTLYGVTMQEPGCSQLVSVRLRDDENDGDLEVADPKTEAA